MKTKDTVLKMFCRTERHKCEDNGEIPYHLIFGMGLAVTCFMLLFVCMGVVSATVIYDGTKIIISDEAETLLTINQSLKNTNLMEPLSEKEWLLKVPIQVQSTGSLYINDADCDWLRLESLNDGDEAYVYSNGGSLQITNTKITSWDSISNDFASKSDGTRAHIRCARGSVSITNSNLSYLGYNNYAQMRSGVVIYNVDDYTISDCVFSNNYAGIYSWSGDNITFSNNTAEASRHHGMRFLDVTNTTIDNNLIEGTDLASGTYFQSLNTQSVISNCTINDTGWSGMDHQPSSYLTLRDCNVYRAGHCGIDFKNENHHINITNCTASYSSSENLMIQTNGPHDFIVKDCVFHSGYTRGGRIYGGHNNTIINCTFYSNVDGLEIFSSQDNLIEDCTFYDNRPASNRYDIDLCTNYYEVKTHYPTDGNIIKNCSFETIKAYDTNGLNTIVDPASDSFMITIADIGTTINVNLTDGKTFKLDEDTECHTSTTLTGPETYTINVESSAVDTLSPTTNAAVTPTLNESGWNNVIPVTVTFFRSDIDSSISYTNYSEISETGPWTTVTTATATGPDAENVTDISESGFDVTLSDEGTTEIWYHSVDSNSNIETTKDVTVKIDTTSTEQEHPDWWSYYVGCGGGTWGRTTAETKTGNHSAFLKGTAYEYATDHINIGLIAGKSDGYTGPDAYTVVPNTTYLLSFWLKGDFTKMGVYAMTWNTEDGSSSGRSWGSTSIGWITPTETWTRYEGTFTTPEDAKKFVVMFKADGDSTQENLGTIYVDDVDVNIGAGNLIMNPGVEDTDSCALSGTVTTNTTQGETGLANATVTLTTVEGTEINTIQTDSTGRYEFTDVSPGNYNINATKRSYWPDSDPVTVTAESPETADIVLCRKGDLNTNSEPADAGDLAMMADATAAGTSDETYDLDGDGNPADAADLTLLKDVSVGVAELE